MNNNIENDALAIWQHMSDRPFDVFSPGELSRFVFGGNGYEIDSRSPNYRRTIRALNYLLLAKVVGRAAFYSTNQSVYWLKEKVK